MKVVVDNFETHQEVVTEIASPEQSFFDFVKAGNFSDGELKSFIDNLQVSADVKAMLYSFSKTTIRIGQAIVKIGRKILDLVLLISKSFPTMTFVVVLALVIGGLLSAIPILGPFLGGFLSKFVMIAGVVFAGNQEMKNAEFESRVQAVVAQFEPLKS